MSRSVLLYTLLAAGAILLLAVVPGQRDSAPAPQATAAAPQVTTAAPQAQMAGLSFHPTARAVDQTPFSTAGGPARLGDYTGTITVVNFWASWCAPCREEMPSLNALSGSLDGVRVVTIATGRTNATQAERFLTEIGADALPRHVDDGGLARALGIMGLPVTLILNREGLEIARLSGDADWNGAAARAMLAELASGG